VTSSGIDANQREFFKRWGLAVETAAASRRAKAQLKSGNASTTVIQL
jgi:hypothetical protein